MPLTTLTHARVRALQGDLRGARRILERLLARNPENVEARRLLEELSEPAAGHAPAGRAGRRIRKLEEWLSRVGRREG